MDIETVRVIEKSLRKSCPAGDTVLPDVPFDLVVDDYHAVAQARDATRLSPRPFGGLGIDRAVGRAGVQFWSLMETTKLGPWPFDGDPIQGAGAT